MLNVGLLGVKRGGFGPELITNGDFSLNSNWTYDTGWSRATTNGGLARAGSTLIQGAQLSQAAAQGFGGFIAGRKYRIRFSVTARSAGAVEFNPASSGVPPISAVAVGNYELIWTPTLNYNRFWLRDNPNQGSRFRGDVDNISAQEVY